MNMTDISTCIDQIMSTVMLEYGPITDTSDYQWTIGIDVIKYLDEMCLIGLSKEVKRTLFGIEVKINYYDPDILQIQRILSTYHMKRV